MPKNRVINEIECQSQFKMQNQTRKVRVLLECQASDHLARGAAQVVGDHQRGALGRCLLALGVLYPS